MASRRDRDDNRLSLVPKMIRFYLARSPSQPSPDLLMRRRRGSPRYAPRHLDETRGSETRGAAGMACDRVRRPNARPKLDTFGDIRACRDYIAQPTLRCRHCPTLSKTGIARAMRFSALCHDGRRTSASGPAALTRVDDLRRLLSEFKTRRRATKDFAVWRAMRSVGRTADTSWLRAIWRLRKTCAHTSWSTHRHVENGGARSATPGDEWRFSPACGWLLLLRLCRKAWRQSRGNEEASIDYSCATREYLEASFLPGNARRNARAVRTGAHRRHVGCPQRNTGSRRAAANRRALWQKTSAGSKGEERVSLLCKGDLRPTRCCGNDAYYFTRPGTSSNARTTRAYSRDVKIPRVVCQAPEGVGGGSNIITGGHLALAVSA